MDGRHSCISKRRMSALRDDEVTINTALFKRYYFYQLFDPNGPKIFDRYVYRSIGVAFTATVLGVNVFSALSFLVDTAADPVDHVDLLLIMFIYCVNAISFLKIAVVLCKADGVWRLFTMTRLDFLRSNRCRTNVAVLHGYRRTSIKVTDFLTNYVTAVFVAWIIIPLALNATAATSHDNERYQNIFNLRYPVTPTVYNRYFCVFYAMELVMGIFMWYGGVVIDPFLISMCCSTIAEFEVLSLAFGSIGHRGDDNDDKFIAEDKNYISKAYGDFISNLYDQLRLYMKLKSFYSVVWIIVLGLIFINSIAMIVLSYSSILIFVSTESFSFFKLFRLPTAYFIFAIQIFLYCYLFNLLENKKETINFGIYSCDWTKMDLKFKKILLLAMRMNNANQLKMKASRIKVVNLQLFANVMTTTYNMVSVMLNKTAKNSKGVGRSG